jgi:hypothetical protein
MMKYAGEQTRATFRLPSLRCARFVCQIIGSGAAAR